MGASLNKAQFALRLCEDHDKKELHAYCKTCEKKICSSCIKEDHALHEWETITELIREKRRSLPEECKEIRIETLPGLKKEIYRFGEKIQGEDSRFERNKCILNSSRQSYIDNINKIFDDRIDECKQKSEATKQIYKDKRDRLKQKVEYLEMMITSLEKDIYTLPDHDILDMEKEMRDELKKVLSSSADKYKWITVFVPGQMDVQAMESMIGENASVDVEEMYDNDRYFKAIQLVKPISITQAWLRVRGEIYPTLIEITEKDIATLNLKVPCYDFIISNSGDFVLSNYQRCIISVLNDKQVSIRTLDTEPLHPTYISKTQNDDILVTMMENDRYDLLSTSRRIVQRMNLTGRVINTYEFRKDSKTRLFTLPTRSSENKNTDICIVNWLSNDIGEIVVLHNDGCENFTYRGDEYGYEKFGPVDVECDGKCRIMFTELYSGSIHILSSEGQYLCALCQYEQLHPWVISLQDDSLWCGFHEGKVKVFKYTK